MRSVIVRLPARQSILGIVSGVTPAQVEAAAARLVAAYCDVPGLSSWSPTTVAIRNGRAGVVVLSAAAIDITAEATIVWGLPIGTSGTASDDEVRRVLADPRSVRDLAGVFVLGQLSATGIRLVTSHDFVFTLRRSHDAFATRAVAALALAGARARIAPAAIYEAVAWEGSVTTGEMLADVTGCEEGMSVEITAGGVTTADVTPLGERMAMSDPLSPAAFRTLLGAEMKRAAAVPGSRLALTEGRDSVLAASCLAEAGGEMPAYTLGYRGYPDSRGAQAAATALGWPHQTIEVRDARGRRLSRHHDPTGAAVGGDAVDWLVRHAAWGEGLQSVRDAIVGHVAWPRAGFVSVTGHGGETGRAFYRLQHDAQDPADAIAVTGAGTNLPTAGQAHFREVISAEVDRAAAAGRRDIALDVIYARRQRGWLEHTGLPAAPVTDIVPIFLGTNVYQAMVNLPAVARLDGSFFAEALALDPRDLYGVATRGATRRSWGRRPRIPSDWPLLRDVMAAFDPDGWLARDVLGDPWWSWAIGLAPTEWWVRLLLWRAVGVEALHRWCDRQPWPS
jgi:hypothetical protein